MSKTMKSFMRELPRNRNKNTNNNTTKITNPSVPAPDLAPTKLVRGPDRERLRQQDRRIISDNTSSTKISTSSEQVDPKPRRFNDKSAMNDKSAVRLNDMNTVAYPNVKPHDTKIKPDVSSWGASRPRTTTLKILDLHPKMVSKKVPAESPVDSKKKLSRKVDLLTFYDCPPCNNCRLERSQCGWCGDEYTPAAAQPEVNDAIKAEKPKGPDEKTSNVALEEKSSSEGSNAISRPVENKKRANAIDDSTHMALPDFKLEESSRPNSQGQVFDIEKPNSVARMDKAKDKVVTQGGYVSSKDHPLQDESEEHGQDGGPPLKPEEHDLDGRDPLKTKTSMDEFKRSTSSDSTAQDHGGGPPRELEEPSLDGQSDSRLNDTYTAYDWSYDDKISTFEAYAVAYDKISTYKACTEAYDDNEAPCA